MNIINSININKSYNNHTKITLCANNNN